MMSAYRKAHLAVSQAIKSGQLQRQPCEVCGSVVQVEAHHADYDKPLDVEWLCQTHHKERHKGPRRKKENKIAGERINLVISASLNAELERMADEQGVSRTELIRRALSLMKVAHQARKDGRFVGIADRASKLDTLIVGLD